MDSESRFETDYTPDIRWVMMLSEYLLRYKIVLSENPNVLNMGCGNNVKWNYLGMAMYVANQGLGIPNYVGVDTKEEAFADAKKTLGGLASFVAGDARKLTEFVTGTYQLAIFQHPNLATSPDGPRIWQKILLASHFKRWKSRSSRSYLVIHNRRIWWSDCNQYGLCTNASNKYLCGF